MTSHFLSGWEASHWEIVVLWSRAGAKSISNLSRDKENGFPPLQTPAELNESIWGGKKNCMIKLTLVQKGHPKIKLKVITHCARQKVFMQKSLLEFLCSW